MPSSTKFFAAAGTSSESMKSPDVAREELQLQPAARRSYLCPCKGEVVEMRGQYGWLKAYGQVDHPMADMHGGHIFLHKQDIVQCTSLAAGDHVSFYLYADEKGIGAELCQISPSLHAPTTQGSGTWSQRWGSAPWQKPAVYYMPYLAVSETVASQAATTSPVKVPLMEAGEDSDERAPVEKSNESHVAAGDLPSVGSAGHADGSCKKCAFFPKGRCLNGSSCTHCHYDHTPNKRLRKRKMQKASAAEQTTSELASLAKMKESVPVDDVDIDIASNHSTESPQSVEYQQSKGSDCFSEDDTVETTTTTASDDEESCERNSCGTPCMSEHVDSSPCASPALASKTSDLEPPSFSELCPAYEADLKFDMPAAKPGTQTRADHECKLSFSPWLAQARARKIVALPCSTPEQLAVLVTQIFEKAMIQDGYRPLYTELCMRLDAHLSTQETSVGGKAFRKALAHECQVTFERYLQPSDEAMYNGWSDDEKLEAEIKLKERRLGNVRFIGELIVKGLLAQKLLPRIIFQLLDGDEAALESVIALLMVTAPVFDQEGSIYRAPLADAFSSLQRRRSDKALSQRLKFHLSDLFDARARRWALQGSGK